MFKETIETVSTGLNIFELAKMNIVVFGACGTGKTTLGRLLSEKSDPSVLADYKESRTTEKFDFSRDKPRVIIIPPGQGRRDEQRLTAFHQVTNGKFRIIINMVSYGYHSFSGLSYTKSKYYRQGMTVEEFLEIYTEECRQEEINQLKEITTPIKMSKAVPTLMMTLVSKQDLWWYERENVEKHYCDLGYRSVVDEITSTRGAAEFSYEYVSASLIPLHLELESH